MCGHGLCNGKCSDLSSQYLKIKIWKSCQLAPYISLLKQLYWFSFEEPITTFCSCGLHWFYSMAPGSKSGRSWTPIVLLEWIKSHQCTSCGWARWGRFPDERKSHPPCPHIYFFFTSSLPQKFLSYLPQNFPSYLPHTSPLLPTTYLPPPTYHLPTPPLSLHRQSSRDIERERAWSRGAFLVVLERRRIYIEEEDDDSCHHFLRWLCCKEVASSAFLLWFCCEKGDGSNVVTFLYGGDCFYFFLLLLTL